MPIFEYRCLECGEIVEKIQSLPVKNLACPRCGKSAERVVSIFSGTSADNPAGGCAPSGGFS